MASLQESTPPAPSPAAQVCFECRCPSVHQKKMSPLMGTLSVLETISQTAIIVPILIIATLLAVFLLYSVAISPCFDCRDFFSVAIHEVGT